MDLKSKLARLPPPISPRSEVEVGGTDAVARVISVELTLTEAGNSQPDLVLDVHHDASNPKQETLQELRARMDAILLRPAAEPPVRANPSETSLPFLPANRGNGKLHRRLMRVAKSKTIGRIPVDAAATARSGLLSLLALDPSLLPCDPKRALYLDTETTGLGGGAGTIAFLIGLAWFDENEDLWLEQLLLTSPSDEPALLECLDERLQSASMLVTFNGKSFDWPLLLGRYVMNRRERPAAMPHLDLLHVARRLHKRRLGSVTLKRLEGEVLGLERGKDIDGCEIGPRYAHFLRSGDESALSIVIEHNATDVLSMAALVGLYGEPIELLAPDDLVGLGRTLFRAGEQGEAMRVAEQAQQRGAGSEAMRLIAQLHKARGDRLRALAQFEELAAEVDDPSVRLELAKLYEHLLKDHETALRLVDQGTGEVEERLLRRRARLELKLSRQKAAALKPKVIKRSKQ